MRTEDLARYWRQRPFHPIRVYLANGQAYEVGHPEMMMVGKRSVLIGLASYPGRTLFDRLVDVDLVQIIRVESLEVSPPPNGPQP